MTLKFFSAWHSAEVKQQLLNGAYDKFADDTVVFGTGSVNSPADTSATDTADSATDTTNAPPETTDAPPATSGVIRAVSFLLSVCIAVSV